jgi:hypothetical protein
MRKELLMLSLLFGAILLIFSIVLLSAALFFFIDDSTPYALAKSSAPSFIATYDTTASTHTLGNSNKPIQVIPTEFFPGEYFSKEDEYSADDHRRRTLRREARVE